MKKILIVLSMVLTLAIGTAAAYADNNFPQMNFQWRNRGNLSFESREDFLQERANFRKDEIDRALEDGRITESQAKEWEDHFKYMDEFHNENGYLNGDRPYGRGCHGSFEPGNMGHRRMMRGYRY